MELNEKHNGLARKCLKVSERMDEIRAGMLRLGFTEEELWQD